MYGSNDLVDASSRLESGRARRLRGETHLWPARATTCSSAARGEQLGRRSGDDSLVSNRGDDTLEGGLGDDLYRIDPGPDPVVIDPGGFNTLDFSIAAMPVNINLSLESGQVQDVDSANDEVSLDGQFDGLIASPKAATSPPTTATT